MQTIDFQQLESLVHLSDVAIRSARQLRRRIAGKAINDAECLDNAVGFLGTARSGGDFIAGAPAHFGESLEPLNWATDTYLLAHRGQEPTLDYAAVADYLGKIAVTVTHVRQCEQPDGASLATAAGFFQALADLLSEKANLYLRGGVPDTLGYSAFQTLRG